MVAQTTNRAVRNVGFSICVPFVFVITEGLIVLRYPLRHRTGKFTKKVEKTFRTKFVYHIFRRRKRVDVPPQKLQYRQGSRRRSNLERRPLQRQTRFQGHRTKTSVRPFDFKIHQGTFHVRRMAGQDVRKETRELEAQVPQMASFGDDRQAEKDAQKPCKHYAGRRCKKFYPDAV